MSKPLTLVKDSLTILLMGALVALVVYTLFKGTFSAYVEFKDKNTVAAPNIEFKTGTPDQAIKTWWQMFDAWETERTQACMSGRRESNLMRSHADKILAGNVLKGLTAKPHCVQDTYERAIESITAEADTRAVIVASVKMTTPVPFGAEVSPWKSRERSQGRKFRYVLEKADQQWKIVGIQARVALSLSPQEGEWLNLYERDKPMAPAYVIMQ